MGRRKKNICQNRLLLRLEILKSLEKSGAGTTEDILRRNIGESYEEVEGALFYLLGEGCVIRKNKDYGVLWIKTKKKEKEEEAKAGKAKSRRKRVYNVFSEYEEKATCLIELSKSKTDFFQIRDQRRRKIGWSEGSISYEKAKRKAALCCLLANEGRWTSAGMIAESLGGTAKSWLPIMRGLIVDGIVSRRHAKGEKENFVYKAGYTLETPTKYIKNKIYDVITGDWKTVYRIAEEANISKSYARLLLYQLKQEGRVEYKIDQGRSSSGLSWWRANDRFFR